MVSVDIVTTVYRNVDKLKICLSSVLDNTKYVDFKWYLWANDPDAAVKDVIHNAIFEDDIQFNDKIIPIYNDNNDGSFSTNNNEAAAEGSGDYILFLNDDCEPINETWLLNMVGVLKADPKVGAVGAMLLYPNKLIQHCGVFLSQKTNNLPFHMHYRQPFSKVAKFVSVPRYYQAVTGACMLVRRADFEQLGGFSEAFVYGFEDVALCLDITHKLGKKIVYNPGAQLIHHEGISGSFKDHPNLQNNIAAFRAGYSDKFYDDYYFYLNDPKFLLYRAK